ncbi:DDB1- and CUL4-associated factor 17 isoform X2 [Engraulis encrasicolus]
MCSKQATSQQCPLPREVRSTPKNACRYLDHRTKGFYTKDAGCVYRRNLTLLREMLLNDDTTFEVVWSNDSKSKISYECGRLYFNNYRRCYTSQQAIPRLLYDSPRHLLAWKIDDALFLQSPLGSSLPSPSDQKPCLLTITIGSWLKRVCPQTGQMLQMVYLSSRHKYRYLEWDTAQETFYAKSTQWKPREAGVDYWVDNLMNLAVFQAFPLKIIGVMEINKRVFGSTVVDVVLNQGVLAVSHRNMSVKLYSFHRILQMFRKQDLILGEPCNINGSEGVVGEHPFGIPSNIHITEAPPVLFEVSSQAGMQIGGNPFHFVYTPCGKRFKGAHHVCSLKDRTLAKNGVQDIDCCSVESDSIYFHPDNSSRIIQHAPNTINVLKIMTEWGGGNQSEIIKDFSISAQRGQNAASKVTVTSSGRTVKRRVYQLDDDPENETFRSVEYEDELDLLQVVVSHREEAGGASVCLHDNNTGALLKRIPLLEPLDETFPHEIILDRDTIVHIQQRNNSLFCCRVYKMTPRRMGSDDDGAEEKTR